MFKNKEAENKNNKPSRENGNGKSVNLIGAGTTIEGEVVTESDARIDGKIAGTVISKAKVVVGTSGVIEGDIKCVNAEIYGRVEGKIEVDELLFLKSTARIEGDITTHKLVVESGATLDGSCTMGGSKAKRHTKYEEGEEETRELRKEAV